MLRRLAPLQCLYQDAFDPAHVDEVHVQGPAAGGVQTLRRVALSQADQLVSLPDLGPWKGTVKEPVGEFGHRRSLLGRAALDALGGSQGVGGQLGWIVGGIGGAAAARLAGMELEQPSPVVDAHQLAAQPGLHPLPRRTEGRRHRVEGVLAGHVVIGMDLGGAPVGDLVGLAVPGGQGLAFLITGRPAAAGAGWCRAPSFRRHHGTSVPLLP